MGTLLSDNGELFVGSIPVSRQADRQTDRQTDRLLFFLSLVKEEWFVS